MKQVSNSERGSVAIIAAFVILGLCLAGVSGFGFWAYAGRQDYKNNVDQKIATAVADNTEKVKLEDAAAFAEEAKNPYKTYAGPSQYGSVNIVYPKSWSAYVDTLQGNTPLNFYAHPDVVPTIVGETSSFAFRAQVVAQSYDAVLRQYEPFVKQNKLAAQPYVLPKTASVTGSRLDGQLTQNKRGAMVIIPMRDKTLKIWTESDTYLKDFNEIILPNLSFTP